jgi:hypothetical protein
MWPDKRIPHRDNAPAQIALKPLEFLGKKSVTITYHPPYSPDLAPCDFCLFFEIKNALKGQIFSDIPNIQRNVTKLLRCIPENDFQGCFRRQKPLVRR